MINDAMTNQIPMTQTPTIRRNLNMARDLVATDCLVIGVWSFLGHCRPAWKGHFNP